MLTPRNARSATLATALTFALAATAPATSTGPQPGMTGVPAGAGADAEMTCVQCHVAPTPEAPEQSPGSLTIDGLPEAFEPGERYTLELAIAHPDETLLRWGFQLTAVSGEGLSGAGEFVVTDPVRTQVVAGASERQYIEHTYNGTAIGEAGGTSWTFDWIAPAHGTDAVSFFATGNAANTDGSQQGDYIVTRSPEPLIVVPPAESP